MFPFCSPTFSSSAVYALCLDALREMTDLVTFLGGVVVLVEMPPHKAITRFQSDTHLGSG